VRATADNPLVDPHLMDEVVKKHIEVKADYTYMKELPLGVATEAISRESLERVASLGKSPHHREHVTTYFKENPSEFNFQVLEPPSYLRRPDLRLTVDTKEDLALMREIYKRLYTPGKMISVSQVIKLLDENPQLRALNIHIKQRVF
jgi:spore coat polysaccharide biosynthesis protein SpsF